MIDWSRIADLKSEIGDEDFAEVVDMFLEEVEEVIDKLRTAPVKSELENDLHFLKSSALNLGFSEFARLCSEGERAAAAGDGVTLAPVIDCYLASKADFALGERVN